MSEAHKLDYGKEVATPSYLTCKTLEDLLSITSEDETVPIVIYGDGTLRKERIQDIAARLRKRGAKNPLVYYLPSRTVSPSERVLFLDAGGDVVVDRRDVGNEAEDPNKDGVLMRQLRILTKSAHERPHLQTGESYEYGITHNVATRTFSVNGVRLPLTTYEYKILDAFFTLRGDASVGTRVPSASISKLLYEDELYERHSNAFTTHINGLNKKLKPYGVCL